MENDSRSALADVADVLTGLRREMLAAWSPGDTRDASGRSAANLAHYLVMRRHDLRRTQDELAALGLSSLGRSESAVLDTVEQVLARLGKLGEGSPGAMSLAEGGALLDERAAALLGPGRRDRRVRVMVTLPGDAAGDGALFRALLESGMDCARINSAHDDERVWKALVESLRRAEVEVGSSCRVLFDLAGPKVRTGEIEPGPRVVKIRPLRDALGAVVSPALVWAHGEGEGVRPPAGLGAAESLPLRGVAAGGLRVGDELHVRDPRGCVRRLVIAEVRAEGATARLARTLYAETGASVEQVRGGRVIAMGAIGELPARPGAIVLRVGDRLTLTRYQTPGREASGGEPARVPLTLPEAFEAAQPGHRVLLDDGSIGCVVERVEGASMLLRVVRAAAGGAKLRADKGVNFPDTALPVAGLTEKDLVDLRFAAAHADMVGLSFAQDPAEVLRLRGLIAGMTERAVGVVLKIETRRAFERLPGLLEAALRSLPAGVMIARGDLAAECGYERLAELQEEILWMCEAAHLPAIWATQVLESLAKGGLPSRAEVTDAAMGERAECVMLNKGPYIVEAVRALGDILTRMGTHQRKKRSMLRRLHVAGLRAEAPAAGDVSSRP